MINARPLFKAAWKKFPLLILSVPLSNLQVIPRQICRYSTRSHQQGHNQTDTACNPSSPSTSPVTVEPVQFHLHLTAPRPTCNTDQSQTFCIFPTVPGILMPLSVLFLSKSNSSLAWNPNPLYLTVAMSLSLACRILVNICIALRFAERSIKKMTLLCILLLSMIGLCLPSRLSFFANRHKL